MQQPAQVENVDRHIACKNLMFLYAMDLRGSSLAHVADMSPSDVPGSLGTHGWTHAA